MSVSPPFERFEPRMRSLIEEHAGEIGARGLQFRFEFDPDLWLTGGPEAHDERADALRSLIRFVLSTVPDACEVYCATSRGSRLTAIGRGELTLRWQVAGPDRCQGEGTLTHMRPRPGNAREHAQGRAASELRKAFDRIGWGLVLKVVRGAEEIVLQAQIR